MAATWRFFFLLEFFKNSLETWYIHVGNWGLRVYLHCPFSCETEKRGYGSHFGFINFNKSFLFSVECLETWHMYIGFRDL